MHATTDTVLFQAKFSIKGSAWQDKDYILHWFDNGVKEETFVEKTSGLMEEDDTGVAWSNARESW